MKNEKGFGWPKRETKLQLQRSGAVVVDQMYFSGKVINKCLYFLNVYRVVANHFSSSSILAHTGICQHTNFSGLSFLFLFLT